MEELNRKEIAEAIAAKTGGKVWFTVKNGDLDTDFILIMGGRNEGCFCL